MRRLLAVLAFAGLVQAPAAAGWSWPVDGPVIRPFVLGSDPYAAGQHRGIDIGGSSGTTVRAATGGSVSFVGTVPAGGRAVTVRTADGLSVTYLELGATRVERGAGVAEGDPIGTIGPASHVHVGVRVTADPQGYLDPLQFLPARVTGTARADPVPDPAAAAEEPAPLAHAVERAEPPAPETGLETTAKPKPKPEPKPEPEPVVPASRPPVAAAAPTTAPAAEPAGVPVTAATTPPAAATERSVEPSREQPRASAGRSEPPQASSARPSPVRDTSARHPRRPSRAASAASRRQGAASRSEEATRTRDRSVDAPLPAARVEPTAVEPRAAKARAIDSPRQADRSALPSGSERRVGLVPLVALLALSLAAALAWALGRRRRGASPHAHPHPLERCSIGRMRLPRLIHTCVRAAETGWPSTPARSRVLVGLHRPLPRPHRRVPVSTGD
jgi:hypothetical protein